jgi:hypothetical protein
MPGTPISVQQHNPPLAIRISMARTAIVCEVAAHQDADRSRVAVIVTTASVLPDGRPGGFRLPGLAHPWHALGPVR